MNLTEAIEIMRKETGGLVPFNGMETTRYYYLDPGLPNGEAIANGAIFVIDKTTGKCGWKHSFSSLTDYSWYTAYPDEKMTRASISDEVKGILSKLK